MATEETGALGYPKQAAFLTIGRATSATTDPTEFSAADYSALNHALEDCRTTKPKQWSAMMMYYKPWVIPAFQAEGWPFGTKTYYNRLHAAHEWIAGHIDAKSFVAKI